MELKEFITNTLVQIMEGVKDANDKLETSSAEVNPRLGPTSSTILAKQGILTADNRGVIQNVDFDIALTGSDGTKTKGAISVLFGAVNLGSSGQSETTNQTVNRIKFYVPITLPK